MPSVVVVAEVENLAKWEEGFRSRGELFKRQTVTNCHYSMAEGNKVAVLFEVDDLETYKRILESPETAKAMTGDGINRETVKVFVLDKQFTP